MDRREKEKLSRYGKLVWDFINEKETDNALTSYFKNLQIIFYFSKDFLEKALTVFPTKKESINSLSSNEQSLVKLLWKRDEILEHCNAFLDQAGLDQEPYPCIRKYDPVNSTFTIEDMEQGHPALDPERKIILINKKDIDAYVAKKDSFNLANTKIKELIEMHQYIEQIKTKLTSRFEEIEKIASSHEQIKALHNHIEDTQKKLKAILLQIIKAENAYEISGFRSILKRYNSIQKNQYTVKNGQILINRVFSEDYFLSEHSMCEENYHIFREPLAYCLVEYLINPEYAGRERLATCMHCNCIFSKSIFNDRQIFCPICSRKNKMTPKQRTEYMKAYRANPARRKAIEKKKREELIRHYMVNAGKTRKEAEIIVEDEV